MTSEAHALMLADDVTSHVTVLMPSSASCCSASILHNAKYVEECILDQGMNAPACVLGGCTDAGCRCHITCDCADAIYLQ